MALFSGLKIQRCPKLWRRPGCSPDAAWRGCGCGWQLQLQFDPLALGTSECHGCSPQKRRRKRRKKKGKKMRKLKKKMSLYRSGVNHSVVTMAELVATPRLSSAAGHRVNGPESAECSVHLLNLRAEM